MEVSYTDGPYFCHPLMPCHRMKRSCRSVSMGMAILTGSLPAGQRKNGSFFRTVIQDSLFCSRYISALGAAIQNCLILRWLKRLRTSGQNDCPRFSRRSRVCSSTIWR
jgi:hypothetical protein